MEFMHAFHHCTVDLRRANRSYMVLLPKREVVKHPHDFRPIPLQNCLEKLLTKCMTTRLQAVIHQLIHAYQIGFLKGRSIDKNFI